MSTPTPDFSRNIDLRLPDAQRRQNVFFQPAVTWLAGATRGVALLMLEYDSNSTDSEKQDFRELVKGFVRWTWAAAGNSEAAAVTTEQLLDLYDGLGDATLGYSQVDEFLRRNYSFVIRNFPAPSAGVEIEATVFPMFPHLELVVGSKPAVSFSPANRTLSSTDVGNLRDYFRQLQAQFETGSKTNTIAAASVAEFMFVGYARLLMRTGMQAAIDQLEGTGGSAASIVALVDAVADSAYHNIAQMASRFLLHGFNLPEHVFAGEVAGADEGLYVSTGQQYRFADSLGPSAYAVTLRMGAVIEPHLDFPAVDGDKRPALTYSVAKTDAASPLLAQQNALQSLKDADLAALHSAKPAMMPHHRSEQLHFALRNRVKWSSRDGTVDHLLPLSSSLRDHLQGTDPNPIVDLIVWKDGKPSDAIDVPNVDFAWATRIELSIARVPDPHTGEALPTIFELGGASEEHKQLLEGVWGFITARNDPGAVALTLLYVADAGTSDPAVATLADENDDVLLVKANLANDTGSVQQQAFSAQLRDKKTFLELIWEGLDVSGGGYYLHLPGIDGDARTKIFSDGSSGIVALLIAFTDNADPIHDFNNCAVFSDALASQINLDNDLLLARSQETVPVLAIPPGFVGFAIDDRPELHGPDNPNSGVDELSVLYQLLGYQIQGYTKFTASNVGLPIGPTELSGAWLYERLVPTYSLVPSVARDSKLPDRNLDPYRGVGTASGADAATLRVDTWWQDIYGNQLLSRKQTTDFPVRYTDAILGINQWPSVTESYAFVPKPGGGRQLVFTFSFDTSTYYQSDDPSQTRGNRMLSDRSIVQSAYYQLIQSDISLEVSSSLDEGWSAKNVDKAGLIAFLADIYQFLDGTSTSAPQPFQQTIDASGIAVKAAFIFELQVSLTIRRSLDRVLDDLKSSQGAIAQEYRTVVEAPARLSPKFEANAVTVESGQSLIEVADAASLNPAPSYSAADVLNALSNRPDVLVSGLVLEPARLDPQFELLRIAVADWNDYVARSPSAIAIRERETPHSLALRFRADIEQTLGRSVEFEIVDLAAVLARVAGLLAAGAVIEIGGMSLRNFASSFQSAFSGLHLAVSEDRSLRGDAAVGLRPLYVVRLDDRGITFDIVQSRPVYFALPPLSNTLLAGEVAIDAMTDWRSGISQDANLDALSYAPQAQSKHFEAIDINVLARSCLVAVEKLLDAASLVPGKRLRPAAIDSILQRKAELAAAISELVTPVLARDSSVAGEAALQARAALRQQLLVDLVNGYDIETIVQFGVTVNVSEQLRPLPWAAGAEPRVRGKAKVLGAQVGEAGQLETIPLRELDRVLDFSISAGKIRLTGGSSFFTYLFDTKKPELLASVVLDLEFVPMEIEYDIARLQGISDHEASNWLAFILPDDLRQPIGAYPIPIPLRAYPQSPSLIQQTADADPTSLTELADVRQWKYTIIYEHPDVSQDSVDCILQLNVPAIDQLPTASGAIVHTSGLFDSLVNFSEVYPQLSADLELLRQSDVLTDEGKARRATIALTAFETLVSRVASDWQSWTTGVNVYAPGEGDVHVEVSEEAGAEADERQGVVYVHKTVASKIGGDSLLPILQLPGYDQKGETLLNGQTLVRDAVIRDGDRLLYHFERDAADMTFFGESSIPDRKLTIENLDVIEHQNAWASVWLSRNEHLIDEGGVPVPTNPAFVFQTPAVRFNNMATPFITNDEPWELATLRSPDGKPVSRPLAVHLQTMIEVLFPSFAGNKYAVRLSCRYAFLLVKGRGVNEDLVTTLPVLLGLEVAPEVLAASYAAELTAELGGWLRANRPSIEGASLLFMVDLFSKLDANSTTSLPMLRITRLALALEHVSDLGSLLGKS
jgi:hypothetical protein